MNRYAELAQSHWKTYYPTNFDLIDDPKTFFTQMGTQMSEQIQALVDAAVDSERTTLNSMSYLDRWGRMTAMKSAAEEVVLSEMLSPSEPTQQTPDEPNQDLPQPGESREEWLDRMNLIDDHGDPMPANRQHPLWTSWEKAVSESATEEESEMFDHEYRQWLETLPLVVRANI